MHIPASRLKDFLDPSIAVRVCHPDGALWKELPSPQVKELAASLAVSGVGSPSRLRYCKLECSPEVAQAIIDQFVYENALAPTARGRLLNTEASQTTCKELISTKRGSFSLIQHRMDRCLAWPNYAHA